MMPQEPADTLLLSKPSLNYTAPAIKDKPVLPVMDKPPHLPKLTYAELPPHVDPVMGKIRVFQFSNGMKFYALPRHEVPLVSWGELYDTGASHEENWNNGVAHFLEHLIFKGTENVKPGEFERRLEGLGARVNAWTSYDHTLYHIQNMPKEGLPEAVKLRAEVVQNALIPAEELEKERHSVIEELNQSKNDKFSKVISKKLMNTMIWGGTPYQRTILGPRKNILNLSREEILDFYARHYGPDKRTIVAVGDFKLPEVLELIATNYNKPFPPQGKNYPENLGNLKHVRDGEPLKSVEKPSLLLVKDPDVNVAIAAHGFDGPIPTQPHSARKLMALDMLSDILGGDQSSRLYQQLVEKEKLATSIGMGSLSLKNRSAIYLSFQSKPEDRETVSKRIREHLDAVIRDGVTTEEMTKVKTMMESALASGLETSASIFETLAMGIGDDKLDRTGGKGLELLRSITPQEIQDVAKEFLTPDREKIVGLIPGEKSLKVPDRTLEKSLTQASKSAAHVHFGGRLHPMDKSVILPEGSELIVRHKPASPSTNISLVLKGGNRADGNIPGLNDHLADWLERGTRELSATELQKLLAEKGMNLIIGTGGDALTISMQGLTHSAQEMFKILGDVINKPAFDPKELAFVKTLRREGHQASTDVSSQYVLDELMDEALYPKGHPYGANAGRIVAAADQATPELVKQAYQHLFHPSNITIGVSGGVSLDQARSWSKPLVQALPQGEVTIPKGGPPPAIQADRTVTLAREGLKQVEIMRAWGAPGAHEADRIPLTLFNMVLGGSLNARLFQRFRSKEQSLCYTVTSSYNPSQDGGDFRFYVGTDPKNIMKVQEVFQEELEKLFKEPPTSAEVARAKMLLKASSLAAAESNTFVSGHAARHRALNDLSIEERLEKINAVTPEEISAVARKYLSKPSITAIVAPKAVLEEHKLPIDKDKEIGQVKAKL